jgi:hypothetical protein
MTPQIGSQTSANWEVGQEVVFTYGYGEEDIRAIDKVERGRAVVAGRKFRDDGSEVRSRGDRSWVTSRIRPATDDDKARIRGARRRASNIAYLRGVDWSAQPADVLERVLAVFGRTL